MRPSAATVFRWTFRGLAFGAHFVAVAAVVVAGLVAVPLRSTPVLSSVNRDAEAIEVRDPPPLSQVQARDGTDLAYRHYPASSTPPRAVAVLIHGSSASSSTMGAIAEALAPVGVSSYAIDVRGHGHTGTRGDIGYIGQLEDDMEDLLKFIRAREPAVPIVLIGHSAGGGFALRLAASRLGPSFSELILLAPYLGYDAPSSRPDSGWDRADIPRVLAIDALDRAGIHCCDALPSIAFGVPEGSEKLLTPTYTYRLMRNFSVGAEYREVLRRTRLPVSLFVGGDDEVMSAKGYRDAVRGLEDEIQLRTFPGVRHMTILADKAVLDAIKSEIKGRVGADSDEH